MDDSKAIALRIASLPSMPVEDVLEVMNQVEIFQQRAKDLRRQLEAQLVEYIGEHGEIEVGDKRWYVGVDKTYKPAIPLPRLVELLMDATGGDFDRFCSLLSANALRPGECRKVLGEAFGAAFETVVRKDLETGKPRRAVKVADRRFAK